jgi:hypothetical protein
METWNKTEGPQMEAEKAVGCYKENCGTDVQVVEFGCMKSAGDVLLLMVSCVTYALGCCNLSKNCSLH